MRTETHHPCQRAIYIEGSARPGTAPSAYDPTNILGGAQYKICGKEGWTRNSNGNWLCEEHAGEEKEFRKVLDICK
jgi:hypothetical protein